MPQSLLNATRRSLSTLGGDAPQKSLNFVMQPQTQSNWCWAAVSTSISHHYNPGSPWTQCKVANAEMNQQNCCQNGSSFACNQPWKLDKALLRVGVFKSMKQGTIAFVTVQNQINADKVIGSRIGWLGGGGHFVVIDGYNAGQGNVITIRDPIYGTSVYTHSSFANGYRQIGTWTHTYFIV